VIGMEYTGVVVTKCPYCGHLNRTSSADLKNQRAEVIECDGNATGCYKFYAIRPVLQVVADVYKMEQVTK
jgi:hypothetical protein